MHKFVLGPFQTPNSKPMPVKNPIKINIFSKLYVTPGTQRLNITWFVTRKPASGHVQGVHWKRGYNRHKHFLKMIIFLSKWAEKSCIFLAIFVSVFSRHPVYIVYVQIIIMKNIACKIHYRFVLWNHLFLFRNIRKVLVSTKIPTLSGYL